MAKLSARRVMTLNAPGMHGDGEGLYLNISKRGSKSWILRVVVHGRRRDLGLGSAKLVSLAEARENARELRKIARSGGDPASVRRKERLTFRQAAIRVHEGLLPTWRNEKHATSWLRSVELYAYPMIENRALETVGTADILSILSPLWTTKHETATRLRQRLRTIFDWAKGAGHYQAENPVNGTKHALPRVTKRPKHLEAMNWRDVPNFMSDLSTNEAMSARTLEFLILTAGRSGEVRGARWDEIEGNIWTVPADRMKRGVAHRVPLSEQAIAILDRVRGLNSELVFPSAHIRLKQGSQIQTVMVFKSLFKRMNRSGFTTHGFRSSFRDWCSEQAQVEREVAEAALSHAVGNEVERAYARSDLFDRRVSLMKKWGQFVAGVSGVVIDLREHG